MQIDSRSRSYAAQTVPYLEPLSISVAAAREPSVVFVLFLSPFLFEDEDIIIAGLRPIQL